MKTKIYLLILIIYVILTKLFFMFQGDLFQYIINPLIWIIFSLIILFCYDNKRYYQYEKSVVYIVIMSSLIYIIMFYSLGFAFEYGNSPYSKKLSGIIINLFSIAFIISLKEYIRGSLINIMNNKFIHQAIICLIFIISDLNIIMIFNTMKNTSDWFTIIIKYIVPVLSLNLFSNYLCSVSGYIPSIIFRISIIIPSLIIPVTPKYDVIIPTLFDTLIPIFTYLIIKYNIDKKKKETRSIAEKPSKWILTFIITIILLMFSLGAFSIKPIVILTGSMKPKINEGDLLIIEKCSIEKVKVGNIIEYKVNDYYVVHRVIKILKNENRIELITKGDNNLKEDKYAVSKENLEGCYKYQIPYLGYPAYLFHKMFGRDNVQIETGT